MKLLLWLALRLLCVILIIIILFQNPSFAARHCNTLYNGAKDCTPKHSPPSPAQGVGVNP
ncbi:hypothetical protein CsatB_014075 [Cannabis sativa]